MKLKPKYKKYYNKSIKDFKILYDSVDKMFYWRDMFIASLYDLQKLENENKRLKCIIKKKRIT